MTVVKIRAPALGLAVYCFATSATAAAFTFIGAGATRSWNDGGNWTGGAGPPNDGTADVTISGGTSLTLDGARAVHSLALAVSGTFTVSSGNDANSILVLGGGSITRTVRGKLVLQAPLLAPSAMAVTGFEAQTALATSSQLQLGVAGWPFGTTVTNMIVVSSGNAVPDWSGLTLNSGAWLDLNGKPEVVGSLAGAGSVTNTSSAAAALIVGLDGTDTTYSGTLGAKLSDQASVGAFDLVKVGGGNLTLTGSSTIGGRVRVAEGTLTVNGTLTTGLNYMVPTSSSTGHGTVRGSGTVGNIYTAANLIPGATIAPGTSTSPGILTAASADLRHGTLLARIRGYATAGVDFDQLNAGSGLTFDGDSELVLDLAGLAATGGPAKVAVFPTNNKPAWTLLPQQIRTINNPNNFTITFNYNAGALNVVVGTSNQTPLFVVTPSHGLVTSESGARATFTVALRQQPAATVTVPIASSNTAEGTVSPSSLVFTTSSWSVPQTVTVTGVDDALPDGAVAYNVNVGPATSADASYSGQSATPVTAVNLDNDLITVSPASGLVTSPPPGAPVTATVTFHGANSQQLWLIARPLPAALLSASPSWLTVTSLYSTPAPWTISLTGPHQLDATCVPSQLEFVPVITLDPKYDGFEIPPVSLCNQGDHAPTAASRSLSVNQGSVLTLAAPGLLAGSADVDLDVISAQLVAAPSHGTASVSSNGALTYTPATGYRGSDSFTYSTTDTAMSSAPATVSVTVNNLAPTPADDSYSTRGGQSLSVTAPGVLSNDTDPGSDPLTAAMVTQPAHGTLSLASDGSFVYTPAAGYVGADSFGYAASDGLLSTNATASISVTDNPPVAANDSYAVNEGAVLTVPAASGVLANDSDPDGDPLSASVVTGPAHGTLSLAADGSFTFTPASLYVGADSFVYAVSDGVLSAQATASIAVDAVAPVAADDAYAVDQGAVLTVAAPGVLGNDSDPSGRGLTVSVATQPAHGTLALNSDGSFSYRPAVAFSGADTFTYTATTGILAATATVTVTVANLAPVARADAYAVLEGQTLAVPAPGVLANDSDPGGDVLSSSLKDPPAHGTVSLGANGSISYTPVAGYAGSDSFTYTTSDGSLSSMPATVTLAIRAVNKPPVAGADAYSIGSGATLTVAAPGLLANDTDADNDSLFAVLDSAPSHGTLTLQADGSFQYIPDAGFTGEDSFTYRASDGATASLPVTVVIAVGAPISFAAASVTCSLEGDARSGGAVVFTVSASNAGNLDLAGTIAKLQPTGLVFDGAVEGGAQLTPDGLALPLLPVGAGLQIRLHGHVTAGRFTRAGAAAQLIDPQGRALGAPAEAWLDTRPLQVDVGGCTSFPIADAMPLLGLLALLRRRRSALPGRRHLHARGRPVADDLGLLRHAAAQRVDGDDGDALLAVVQTDVGAELAARRHLDRLALDVDAAARLDAPRDRHAGPVGLLARPLDGEEHLLERGDGLFGQAVCDAHDLALPDLEVLAGGDDLHRAGRGGDGDGAALGGDDEVAAFAVGGGAGVVDLEADAGLALGDVGLDAAANARGEAAGARGGQVQLAAVVEDDARAVDGDDGHAADGSAQAVLLPDAVAAGGLRPIAAAALQLDRTLRLLEHRAGLSGRRRHGASVGDHLRGRRRPSAGERRAGGDEQDPAHSANLGGSAVRLQRI